MAEWFHAHYLEVGQVALQLLGAFSIIAKLTPTTRDDTVLAFLQKVIHFFGLTKNQAK